MIQEQQAREIVALTKRVDKMATQIETLTGMIRNLLDEKGEAQGTRPASREVVGALYGMTIKQHVAMQMLLAGCSNADIAKQLGITENTAKVHVRIVASKVGAKTRAQVVAKVIPALESMSAEDYMVASGGLPIDWAETYRLQENDPCKILYM